ncbi:MAG TPA: ribosome biogenesis GTP-binding protein YihA/YsxC [Casimicrobiaceae bacterium]|jgi:GTP-binding protein
MKKRAIVTESPRSAKGTRALGQSRVAGPLVGAKFEGAAAALGQLPPAGPGEIAFAGRSNSGKSSAINALARQTRLAYASRTPGRTRQINFFRLRNGARVADLPGYGYAAVPRALKREWQDLLWHYVTSRTTLIALIVVVDARHGMTDLDYALLEGFVPSARPVLILATKADKLNVTARRDAVVAIRRDIDERFGVQANSVTVLLFSATSRAGAEAADAVIAAWLPSSAT